MAGDWMEELDLKDIDVKEEGPYFIVTLAVVGVWVIALCKKLRMDRRLGLHRAKQRTA